jgi:hypothetical protein
MCREGSEIDHQRILRREVEVKEKKKKMTISAKTNIFLSHASLINRSDVVRIKAPL